MKPTNVNAASIARRSRIVIAIAAVVCLSSPALSQPTIITEPRTQFAWENRRVSLNVTAKGTAPLTYQWQFDGSDISRATNRSFTLPKVQLTNDGAYCVVVADPTETITSQVARVMVRAWPQPTGPRIPELARLDTHMQTVLLNYALPGGSLAVVKDGRLVFARGYGYADVEHNEQVQPDSLFRIASLSKTITAATMMKLVEDGKLDLETPAFGLLKLEPPKYPGAVFDNRLTNITVRQLLNHSGGWNRDTAKNPLGRTGFEPVNWPDQTAQDLGLTTAPTATDVVRWMIGKPLQFKPGTAFAYSGYGFDVAGRVIEKVTGQSYETAARQFLAQGGITRMRVGGNTRAERAAGEVVYYLDPGPWPATAADFTQIEAMPINFDLPYAWPITLFDAGGGLIGSAIDYARFVAAIDAQSSYPDILSTDSVATMLARPKSPASSGDGYFGLGWDSVNPSTGVWWKAGADTAWASLAMRRKNGVIFVFLLNSNATGAWEALYNSIPTTTDSVHQWPANDLFAMTLSYDAWRAKHFSNSESADLTLSADDADPDGDGVVNLLEFAHGTDPRASSESPRLLASIRTDVGKPRYVLNFRRLLLEHELNYTIEASTDLKTWSAVNGDAEEPALNAESTLTTTLRFMPSDESSAQFLRLRVSRKPVP